MMHNLEAFGLEREQELKNFLELPNEIPDGSTFFRVFKRIKPDQPGWSLYKWLAGMWDVPLTAVNIDEKTIRGSRNGEHNAVHEASAWRGMKRSFWDRLR
jgi:hypothetical protein